MKNLTIKFLILALLLGGLPILGLYLAGDSNYPYFEFPPVTLYIVHKPFSFYMFSGMSIFVLSVIMPFFLHAAKNYKPVYGKPLNLNSFPWWGYSGFILCGISWILAWTRFGWFTFFQLHTYIPLWIAFILIMNALCWQRCGSCLITDFTGCFLMFFPVSAVFWWFFEYLNRFVQNWYYLEIEIFSPTEYFIFATLSFSTVLPAVLSTQEWLLTFPIFTKTFKSFKKISIKHHSIYRYIFITVFGASLAGIALYPDFLYPFLWVSPVVIIVVLQSIMREKHIFSDIGTGDWSVIVTSAIAALICGFFWEMWNYYSFAKWIYFISYLEIFHIFEMPVIGFAGYLPFGIECAIIGQMILKKQN